MKYLVTSSRFFCAVLLMCCQAAVAQFQPQNLIKHYSIKHGLSQGVVNSIAQDDESLIWVATEDGLNRFDGYAFKVFKYNKEARNGLADNFIQNLFKDSDGTLWVSSRKGLLKFDPNLETFRLYQHTFNASPIATPNDVSFITEGAAKNLWVAWYGSGFASFDKKTAKFTPYNTAGPQGLSSDKTVSILEDKFGLLWVGTQDGGLNVFKVGNGQIITKIDALSKPSGLPAQNVRCMVEDKLNNIWIGTSKGLTVYLRQQNRFVTFNAADVAVAGKSIFSLIVDSNENLFIGTQGGGLYQLDVRQLITRNLDDLIFTQITQIADYDISKKTIQSFYQDSYNNLWVGTFGDGVYMIGNEKEKFIKVRKALYNESTVSMVPYYGMCYDHDGNLWLGTDGNGLYVKGLDGKDKRHYTADGKKGSLKDNAILSALCDSRNQLWFGTYSQGVFAYNKATDAFIHYTYAGDNPFRTGGHDVRAIYEDADKNIWVGTNRGGLCLIDQQTRTYGNPTGFSGALRDGDIRAITGDTAGNLWLGFYGDGLYRYNHKTKSVKPFFHDGDARGELQTGIVFSLNADRQGKLWIGSGGGGLYCYDTNKNTLKVLTEHHGLANNTIYAILIDNNGNCWMSTNTGVSKYAPGAQKFVNYETLDGLQEGQFNPGSAVYNYVAGYMCFGGTLGVNVFYPEQIVEERLKPRIMISGLQIFNKPVSINDSIDGSPILNQVINRTRQITLKHDQAVITLEFLGLSYNYPEKNNYAYKLEGLDDDWNYVGHQRSATYRYLKPGHYVFKVKASNQENAWSDDYASLAITINPPFWRTPMAYLLYFVILGTLGLVVFRFSRKQYILRKRLKIEKAQRKNERRLAMEKLTFFTEVSHEFRTPLTLIMGPLEDILSREDENSANGQKLKMVHRNAHKLLALINKLIDYRKIESGKVVLRIREADIVTFVDEIFITFKELAATRKVKFEFHAEQPSINAWFDKEKMEMVLNNIISNSFKYIGTGDEITVCAAVQISDKFPQGRVVIKVKDNGIGIPKKHMSRIFEWFYKGDSAGIMNSGIGLSLARKLVHLHKGEIFVESTEGKGSVFSIKVPLGKDHFKPDEVILVAGDADEMPNAPGAAHAEADGDHASKKGHNSLLIIEDDEEIRAFLRDYFSEKYKIHEASNGQEGWEICMNLHPDMVISDIMMPGLSGIDLCRQLKANMRTSHIPVILLTAKTSLTHHKEGIETGADAYITKPFSPEILSLTVNNLLQSRHTLMRFYRNLFMDEPAPKTREPETPDEKFLHSIYNELKANLDKPEFNINELSDVLNMSRSLVYKKVKMLTGLSPVEYVRSLRMQEAAKLLKSHKYKVFEVVYMVGFSDAKYFRRLFIKEFGVSPSDYIKQAEPGPPVPVDIESDSGDE